MRLTKKQALAEFREMLKQFPELKDDRPAKCEAWNNFTDGLCKDRFISLRQYETWTNPF